MSRDARKVRKSIMKRRRSHRLDNKSKPNQRMGGLIDPFPQDEEKHGYFPTVQNNKFESNNKRFFSSFAIKGILSIFLFFGTAFIFQMDLTILKTPKQLASYALTEEFPFARVHNWYQASFGSPLAFTPENSAIDKRNEHLALPVIGNVTEPFQANGTGIMIAPKRTTPVSAWNAGVIIFAGNDRETNKTVIVQHADNSKSVYGYLSSIDVHIYQFIGASEKIGTFNPGQSSETIYFSLEKDNEYIDPTQVIKVDDF